MGFFSRFCLAAHLSPCSMALARAGHHSPRSWRARFSTQWGARTPCCPNLGANPRAMPTVVGMRWQSTGRELLQLLPLVCTPTRR
ncbi:hypothetical protein PVAP13_2KG094032 [Panicum virgatum]|uniref:Secreted protein n=1 Tax=Panicum virgatum TaxID=38727 RepID=A0A8T0W4X6_PANVG|nr:hypothetical protein PVAP13_2KG094032 [Panicum virgatum]